MISKAPGSKPEATTLRNRIAGRLQAVIGCQHGAVHLRARHQAQSDFQGDAEQAFRTDIQPARSEAVVFQAFPAQLRPLRHPAAQL